MRLSPKLVGHGRINERDAVRVTLLRLCFCSGDGGRCRRYPPATAESHTAPFVAVAFCHALDIIVRFKRVAVGASVIQSAGVDGPQPIPIRHFQALAVRRIAQAAAMPFVVICGAGLDGEPCLGPADAPIPPVAGPGARRRRAHRAPARTADPYTGFLQQRPLALFHVCAAIALVGADGTGRVSGADRVGVRKGGHALQLVEYGLFVGKQVANESSGMLLFHGQRSFRSWPQYTGREDVREGLDVGVVCRCEVNQPCEMVHTGIQSGDVGKPKLREGLLEDADASAVRSGVRRLR